MKKQIKSVKKFHEAFGIKNLETPNSNIDKNVYQLRYKPRSPYSASKASSDHLVEAWNSTYELPTLITNCSNNYGPWQYPEKLIPLIINKAIKMKNIPIYGNGKNIRDWLFVEDHVEALVKIAEKGKIGKSYCVGGSNEKTNKICKEVS